jgi:hydroxymethylbilane synthase
VARPLRIGTRGSPLALAQARLVAAALAANGDAAEFVTVKTRGDHDLATPLPAADADFFSAELDAALLAGDVDACVHSLKDLPPRRPAGIARAAMPRRANPRDVVVFAPDVDARLRSGATLRIGCCSERRRINVGDFLPAALPAVGPPPRLEFHDLRGAVDQRLAALHRAAGDPAGLDAIVLALAGLERLWNDAGTRHLVEGLLAGTRLMVLPLDQCPAAAGQGNLVVECRSRDIATRERLVALHDPGAAAGWELERAALADIDPDGAPGVGATAVPHAALGLVCHVRGRHRGATVGQRRWNAPPRPATARPFDGIGWQRLCTRRGAPAALATGPRPAIFVAYWHAAEYVALPLDARLWTSGPASWRQLAARGHWVEGCADTLGFAGIVPTLATPVLQLPALADWTAITYASAVAGWRDSGIGQVLATYELVPPSPGEALDALRADARQATHCYWSSIEQYRALADVLPAAAHHACGAGKTLASLHAAGAAAVPFPGHREWRAWLP